MKTTRSFNLARVLLLAALAAGLNASLASAQDYKGTFTLPFEARWGAAVLPAGDYSFTVDPYSTVCIAKISQGTRYLGMVMATGRLEQETGGSSALTAVRSGGKYRITALRLAEDGVIFSYLPPKAERQQFMAQAPQLIRRVPVLMAAK